ncbi:MAG: PD-(D/E)XK nuclease family protein [Desulfosalsimonadaceae bacterium]
MTLPEAITSTKAREMVENQSAVLVTVNQRLARYLKNQYNDRQYHSGRRVWETPLILPYGAWLEKLYNEAAISQQGSGQTGFRMLLSKTQEGRVWEQVIGKWDLDQGRDLLQVSETARPAMEAWELCREWRVPMNELGQAPSDDTAAFLEWAKSFERLCREKGWQDRAGLADAVMDLMQSGHIKAPRQIILAGFDELSPCKSDMIQVMMSSGTGVYALSDPLEAAVVLRHAASDAEAEMAAAACWGRACLEGNPDSRIGIVVPDLRARRPALIRHLDDVFHPSRVLSPDDSGPRVYNISLGRPLSDYPVVIAALQILNFLYRPLDAAQYGAFLRSPFLAGAEAEISLRALLDARIREAGETGLPLSAMIYYAAGHDTASHRPGVSCPKLHARLKSVQKLAQSLPNQQQPSEWARYFQSISVEMGWPGERTLTTDEYQAVGAWHDALAGFAALDRVCSKMDMAAAIDEFTRILAETTFQPETGDAPVQILGILESAGERFTHLWVMGLDAETWPPASRPNPFLPVWAQRRYHVPHGSPEREFEFARRTTDQLLGSASQVILSYPLRDGDTELAPSPLIEGFEGFAFTGEDQGWRLRICQSAAMDTVIDRNGPEVNAETRISGGTGLLKAQAACPFSAFATFRLGARPLETPEPGLNARDRGNLVHKSLEFFWEHIKTHATLVNLPQEELTDVICRAVDQAVSQATKDHPRTFTRIFTRLETRRLKALLLEWLAVDRERFPFTVSDREKRLACTVGGLELKTFADRIDRLDDGRLVIVDYKTGEPKVQDWFSERIAEPQLPLYSFAVNEPVAGVVFGQIRKGRVKYLGVAEEGTVISGVSSPDAIGRDVQPFAAMSEVIAFWHHKIEILAQEVRQGIAWVAPVLGKTTCRYCGLGPLCRIKEAEFLENTGTDGNP